MKITQIIYPNTHERPNRPDEAGINLIRPVIPESWTEDIPEPPIVPPEASEDSSDPKHSVKKK